MLSRRTFVKAASGLLLAAGAGELLLPERRVWVLDRTMVGRPEAYEYVWNGASWHTVGIWIDDFYYPVTMTAQAVYMPEFTSRLTTNAELPEQLVSDREWIDRARDGRLD